MRRNKAHSLPAALCSSVVLLHTPQKRQAGKELVRQTQARFDSLVVPRGSSTKTILKILAPGTRSCPRYPEFLLPMIGGFFLWRRRKTPGGQDGILSRFENSPRFSLPGPRGIRRIYHPQVSTLDLGHNAGLDHQRLGSLIFSSGGLFTTKYPKFRSMAKGK